MHVLLTLLIVAALPAAPMEAGRSVGDGVFSCSFDAAWDKDYDGWPDGWSRRRGPGFPSYVKVAISHEPSPAGDRCLRIDLDGGGAAVYSPQIPVSTAYGYVVECLVNTEGLAHDRAFLSITLLDEDRHRLATYDSQKVRQTDGWTRVRLGPITSDAPDVRQAVLGLHLEPGESADLTGSARFADVRLSRLPRVAMSLDSPQEAVAKQLFAEPKGIVARLHASGFSDRDARATFRLTDVDGNTLVDVQREIKGDSPIFVGTKMGTVPQSSAAWPLPVSSPGFYRVNVEVTGDGGRSLGSAETGFAVIASQTHHGPSEFGWTLPGGERPYTFDEMVPLLVQSGVGCVKVPLWLDAGADPAAVDDAVRFSRQLAARGIELVGVLADPPFDVPGRIDPRQPASVAEIFTSPKDLWLPSLAAVMAELGTEVRRWQLGLDTDKSFVDYPDLDKKIEEIKTELGRTGASPQLGFAWDEGWAVIRPLGRENPIDRRAADLVRQIIDAKARGARRIFVPAVFDAERGLFGDDGTPGELLLPWRTAAMTLGGAEPSESVQLPSGGTNQCFARGEHVVMIAWSDTPHVERIFLGHDVRQLDLWGREMPVSVEDGRQQIAVGPLPTLVTGLDGQVLRWRQSVQLAATQVPCVFGQPHAGAVQFVNPLGRAVEGSLALAVPSGWRVEPSEASFTLSAGGQLRQPFALTLPFDTTAGCHPIRIDFELREEGKQATAFSVYRQLEVGLGDVAVELSTRIVDSDTLEVRQKLVNRGAEPVSFRCLLLAPGRRMQRTEILDQAPGDDVRTYHFPNGSELLGKTLWLRAEDLDRGRMLNDRVEAKR